MGKKSTARILSDASRLALESDSQTGKLNTFRKRCHYILLNASGLDAKRPKISILHRGSIGLTTTVKVYKDLRYEYSIMPLGALPKNLNINFKPGSIKVCILCIYQHIAHISIQPKYSGEKLNRNG